jgi:adenosylhomocysteine nucleosidase
MTALERLTAVAVAGTVAWTGCAAGRGASGTASPARPRILVVTAVDYEQAAIRAVLREAKDGMIGGRAFTTGRIDGAEVVAIRAGWGKAHAAGATALGIERFRPDLVVMAGISGGLDPERATSGDVVVGADTFQHDLGLRKPDGDLELWPAQTPLEKPYPGPRFTSPPELVAAAAAAARQVAFRPWMLPPGCACENDGRRKPSCTGPERRVDREVPRVLVGTLATGDVFLADRRLAQALASREQAVSVDMETAAVAQEAADHDVPFLGVRLVSDLVGGPDGDALYYCLKPQSGPRLGALMEKILPAIAAVPAERPQR